MNCVYSRVSLLYKSPVSFSINNMYNNVRKNYSLEYYTLWDNEVIFSGVWVENNPTHELAAVFLWFTKGIVAKNKMLSSFNSQYKMPRNQQLQLLKIRSCQVHHPYTCLQERHFLWKKKIVPDAIWILHWTFNFSTLRDVKCCRIHKLDHRIIESSACKRP